MARVSILWNGAPSEVNLAKGKTDMKNLQKVRRGTEKIAVGIPGKWKAKCQSVNCQFLFRKGSFLSAYYDATEHAKNGHATDISSSL